MIIGSWLNAIYAFICDTVDTPPWNQSKRNPMSFDIIGPDCTTACGARAYTTEPGRQYAGYNLFLHHYVTTLQLSQDSSDQNIPLEIIYKQLWNLHNKN